MERVFVHRTNSFIPNLNLILYGLISGNAPTFSLGIAPILYKLMCEIFFHRESKDILS
jgi:hypothetical protein